MKVSIFAVSALALAVAGCVATAPPPTDFTGECRAAELQGLVGQPGSVLQGMRFAPPVRIIHYGMPVTMDFNPARLNIQLDRHEVIESVSCG